jgi:hypothetical protein
MSLAVPCVGRAGRVVERKGEQRVRGGDYEGGQQHGVLFDPGLQPAGGVRLSEPELGG